MAARAGVMKNPFTSGTTAVVLAAAMMLVQAPASAEEVHPSFDSSATALPPDREGLRSVGHLSPSRQEALVSAVTRSVRWADSQEAAPSQSAASARTETAAPSRPAFVTVPSDPREAVTLSNSSGPDIGLGLPAARRMGTAVDHNGMTMFMHPSNQTAIAVQPTGRSGVRALVHIAGPEAPPRYRFRLDLPEDARLQKTPDGSVIAVAADGKSVLGHIAKPWARDAAGNEVATRYKIKGETLIQRVAHEGATYPVVADPWVQWNSWGYSIYFSRWETTVIGWGIGAVGVYFGWTGWAAVAAYSASGLASWAASSGYCLAMWMNWRWYVGFWVYRC